MTNQKNNGYAYLASPYTHSNEKVQTDRANAARFALAKLMTQGIGMAVYSPIVHGCAVNGALPIDYQRSHAFWMGQCMPLLRGANALVLLDIEGLWESRGVAMEIVYAKKTLKPIFIMRYPAYNGELERIDAMDAIDKLEDAGNTAYLNYSK